MFSGIGGFEYGIQDAYRSAQRRIETDKARNEAQGLFTQEGESSSAKTGRVSQCVTDFTNKRPLCVGYSEIDRYAISVYKRHFKGHKNYGDATTINPDELPDFDLLVGGFPCQAFSVAGKRAGFNDTRGTLFFDVARILSNKTPRYLVLENVKGLLTHDNGRTFQTILTVLTDIGYHIQWQVLNSKDFGVPQNRERVYIVGHFRGQPRPKVFPITTSNPEHIRQINPGTRETERIYDQQGLAPTLNTMQGGQRQPKIGVIGNIYPSGHEAGNIYDTNGLSPTIKCNGPRPNAKNVSPKIVQGRIRRLTPLECERLQGFPDEWTKYDFEGKQVSDSQRYKMCGNAVTTNVIRAVFNGLWLASKE